MKTQEELIMAVRALEEALQHLNKDEMLESISIMAATDALKWAAGYAADTERLEHFYKGMEIALEMGKK